MIDDKDKQIFDLTKHIRVLTEMMAEDHEIILSLRTQLFLERNRNPSKDIYYHFTCATDTDNVQKVIMDSSRIILKENMRKAGLLRPI